MHEKQTAFICPYSFCLFKLMPFGLKKALEIFQWLMDTVLVQLSGSNNVVSSMGIEADPDKKTFRIFKYPPTRILSSGYWAWLAGIRFMANYCRITEPLNILKWQGGKFLWTSDCQAAFDSSKEHLVHPPIPFHPRCNLPFLVYTDTREVDLGAVLIQRTEEGNKKPVLWQL